MLGECDPSFRRRASAASEQDQCDLKVSNKEGHAQHQRDADNDDEDKESAHSYSSMRYESPIRIVGRTFFGTAVAR
jgi:hypothetical protein